MYGCSGVRIPSSRAVRRISRTPTPWARRMVAALRDSARACRTGIRPLNFSS